MTCWRSQRWQVVEPRPTQFCLTLWAKCFSYQHASLHSTALSPLPLPSFFSSSKPKEVDEWWSWKDFKERRAKPVLFYTSAKVLRFSISPHVAWSPGSKKTQTSNRVTVYLFLSNLSRVSVTTFFKFQIRAHSREYWLLFKRTWGQHI